MGNQNTQNNPSNFSADQSFPVDSPVATPSDFFPPEPPVHHSKNPFNGKIIATVLGLAVLAGGLGAGVVLVQQPQRVESLAYFTQIPANICPTGMTNKCQTSKFSYGGNSKFNCQKPRLDPVSGSVITYDTVYCCSNVTDVIVDNRCRTGCGANTTNCNQNITGPSLTGAKTCYSNTGTKMYCCAPGYSNLSGICTLTPQAGITCNTTSTKYETISYGGGCGCSIAWTCSKDAGAATKTWHSDGKCTPTFGVTYPASCSSCFTNGVWNNSCT